MQIAVIAGSGLLREAGTIARAATALREAATVRFGDHFAELQKDELEPIVPEELLTYARHVAEYGVDLRHLAGGPSGRVRSKAHKSAQDHLDDVLKNVWKDASKGRILLCSERQAGEETMKDVVSSPFARVPKQNPDRTLSDEGRVIWDGHCPNAGCDKLRHPPALQPNSAV